MSVKKPRINANTCPLPLFQTGVNIQENGTLLINATVSVSKNGQTARSISVNGRMIKLMESADFSTPTEMFTLENGETIKLTGWDDISMQTTQATRASGSLIDNMGLE